MMRNILLVGAALLVLLGVGAYLLFYSAKAKTTRVTVAGVSEAQLSPDTAVVTLSVVTNGAQALNAQQDNAAKSEAVKKGSTRCSGAERLSSARAVTPWNRSRTIIPARRPRYWDISDSCS